jgi:hypothetical protein
MKGAMNMTTSVILRMLTFCAATAVILTGCGRTPSTTFTVAPPGPADLGPATGLSTPSAEAVVFDLRYRAQTGGPEDIAYRSYWGYGGSDEETRTDPFLQAVRDRSSSRLHYVCNFELKSRKWAAIELRGRHASALYFDLNADGRFSDNERLLPTREEQGAIEFITPDFVQERQGGGQTLCRVLLNVRFYEGNSEPNTMWSPAALLEGTAIFNGEPARLLLYAGSPGGVFDEYGSSSYSLLSGARTNIGPQEYIPRERLSSLIASEGQFYRLTLEGRRSNGLPARALLTKDASPTGTLAVKLAGSNALSATIASMYLDGVADKTAHLRVSPGKDAVVLPEGTYKLTSGTLSYGAAEVLDWELGFSEGPAVAVKGGRVIEQRLGQPKLQIHAISESDRWNRETAATTKFKRGTSVYFEPKIVGSSGEVFTRFRQDVAGKPQKTDRPPFMTITGPDGKEVFAKTMEYG